MDIGNYLIKYSLFAVYDKSRCYLASFELKDANKIVEDGIINYNLFNRDLTRKIDSLSEITTELEIIVLPLRSSIVSKTVPSMELKDKKSEMLKDIKKEFEDIQTPEGVYDWCLLKEDSDKDVSSVFLESVTSTTLFPILNALVDSNVKSYKVVSPSLSMIPLTEYSKDVTLMVDIGHSTVNVNVIEDSVVVYTTVINVAGKDINNKFNGSLIDAIKVKHSSLISELPSEVHNVFDTIKKEIQKVIETVNRINLNKIQHIRVIGGHANTDIENILGLDSLRVPITHVTLDLENVSQIPREVVAYLTISYGALMNEVDSHYKEFHDHIDYSAPKNSTIMRIKKISQVFSKYRYHLIGITASILLSLGLASYGAHKVNVVNGEINSKMMAISGEVVSLSEQHQSLEEQYTHLVNNSSSLVENENLGDLVDYIANITPPNFNIKEFSLESLSNTGLMKVTSDSEIVTSTFITLLQDQEKGAFNKVNIIKVDIREVSNVKYYDTYLFLEGRRF